MRRKRGAALMALGLLLLLGAGGLALNNALEERRADLAAEQVVQILERQVLAGQQYAGPAPERAVAQAQSVVIEGERYLGLLEIPALELSLPVADAWSDALLKQSPCRYDGSLPEDDMIVAGHNYKRQFGALSGLAVGDEVFFTDVTGRRWGYCVVGAETVAGDDVAAMKAGEWDLTLFTCTYSRTDRAAIRCQRQEA